MTRFLIGGINLMESGSVYPLRLWKTLLNEVLVNFRRVHILR